MIVYNANEEKNTQRELAMKAILADITATYGVDTSIFTEDELNQIIVAHAKAARMNEIAKIASDVVRKLVETMTSDAMARKEEEEKNQVARDDSEMERVVSLMLIPMIDPDFKKRTPKVQQEIHDAVMNFYLVTTSIPCASVEYATAALEQEINRIIQSC